MEKIWEEILIEIDKAFKEGRKEEVEIFLNELQKILVNKFGIGHPYTIWMRFEPKGENGDYP